MSECVELEWSRDSLEAAPWGRLAPGHTRWRGGNNADLDCRGLGIQITDSQWAIAPEDDDGELSIDNQSVDGLNTYALITATLNQDQRIYHIINTITTSDGETFSADYSLPVVPTRTPWR